MLPTIACDIVEDQQHVLLCKRAVAQPLTSHAMLQSVQAGGRQRHHPPELLLLVLLGL